MFLYYVCSNWNGLSMYPRMIENAGKRTLGWQVSVCGSKGTEHMKYLYKEQVLNTFCDICCGLILNLLVRLLNL